MARPREFVEADVVRLARDAFWRHGVTATSIGDLCQATGLASGSIYKAFGSKAGLHRATLEDYLGSSLSRSAAALREAESPVAALREWLDVVADQAGGLCGERGCYAVQAASELAADDEWVRARVARHDRDLVAEIADALRRAAVLGEADCDDPEAAAHLLMTVVHGVQLQARTGIDAATARSLLHLALDRLT